MSRYPFHLTYMKIILHYLMFSHLSYFTKQTHTHTHSSINMFKQAAASLCGIVANFFHHHHLFSTFPLLIFITGVANVCLHAFHCMSIHNKIKMGTKGREKIVFLGISRYIGQRGNGCVFIQEDEVSYCENALFQSY